eukprot:TRINITY_DN111526_c0_g1_i1.p2 TRINITY_DN111526_c0_g1~~TRINITY_DN111526_c0_g1_i1.p2  ORF type:complete len:298 (-),score=86.44 TRINITY_DN111526_c0_g1_i1:46-843(-)
MPGCFSKIFVCVSLAGLMEGVQAAHLMSRAVANGVATKTKSIVELDEEGFSQSIVEPTGESTTTKWVVLFHSSADAQSKIMQPSFENMLARMLGRDEQYSKVGVAKVDCAVSQALCAKLNIAKYPSVLHYQDRQVVAAWTSGLTGLVPWLHGELAKSAKETSLTLGVASLEEAWDLAWQALQATKATRRAIFEVSHLEAVHDLIFMEDCDFSRLLSFLLLLAIVGKTAGIVCVDGAELRLSGTAISEFFARKQKTKQPDTSAVLL